MDEFGLESVDPPGGRGHRPLGAGDAGGHRPRPGRGVPQRADDGRLRPAGDARVAVTVRGDEMLVDYAGTSPASDYGINVVLNYTEAYTTFGLKCALAPEVPNNEGSFRPVTITAPPGCILNAPYPARSAAAISSASCCPARCSARWPRPCPTGCSREERIRSGSASWGERPENGKRFTYVWFSVGGTGALATKDGLKTTAFPSGVAGVPAEVIETLSAVWCWRSDASCAIDSAAPGVPWRPRPDAGAGRTGRAAVHVFGPVRADRPSGAGPARRPARAAPEPLRPTGRRSRCTPRPACRCPAAPRSRSGCPGAAATVRRGGAIPPACSRTSGTATCRSSAPAPVTASRSTRRPCVLEEETAALRARLCGGTGRIT